MRKKGTNNGGFAFHDMSLPLQKSVEQTATEEKAGMIQLVHFAPVFGTH